MTRRFVGLQDEFEARINGRCDCETYFFCEWHQRVRNPLEDVVESLRQEDLHDEYLDLLERLCECTPTERCHWHQAFTGFDSLKDLIEEMEAELAKQHYLWSIEQDRRGQ